MGLDHAHILSSERHHSEFVCGACRKLTSLDSFVSSVCSHPICRSCVGTTTSIEKCPLCKGEIGSLEALDKTQPLAHRVLCKIKIACPVRKSHHCVWTGDFGNLTKHMESHRSDIVHNKNQQEEHKESSTLKARGHRHPRAVTRKSKPTRRNSIGSVDTEEGLSPSPSRHDSENPSGHDKPRRRRSIDLPGNQVRDTRLSTRRNSCDDLILPPEQKQSLPIHKTGSVLGEEIAGQSDTTLSASRRGSVSSFDSDKAKKRWSIDQPGNQVRDSRMLTRRNSSDNPIRPAEPNQSLPIHKTGIGWNAHGAESTAQHNAVPHFDDSKCTETPNRSRGLLRTASMRIFDRNNKNTKSDRSQSPTDRIRQNAASMADSSHSNDTGRRLYPRRKSSEGSVPRRNNLKIASTYKEQAAKAFREGNHQEAVSLYTCALDAIPCPEKTAMTISLYCDRAAALLRTHDYSHCIRDCDETLRWDGSVVKAYSRKAWALIEVNLIEDAIQTLEIGLLRLPKDPELTKELRFTEELYQALETIQQLQNESKYNEVMTVTKGLSNPCRNSKFILLARANAFYHLNNLSKAEEEVNKVFGRDMKNADALFIRAKVRFLEGRLEDAILDCQMALGIDSERKDVAELYDKVRVVESHVRKADMKVQNKAYDAACHFLSKAIESSEPLEKSRQLYRKLHLYRSRASFLATNHVRSLFDANLVLEEDAENVQGWEIKATVLAALKKYKQLKDDLGPIINTWGSGSIVLKEIYKEACNPETNYYGVLGVDVTASDEELRKAYMQKSHEYHPDKNQSIDASGESGKQLAEEKLKTLQNCWKVLGDRDKRHQYDQKRYAPLQQAFMS